MNYITSDLHWHHANILKFPRMMKYRGDLYKTVEEMDADLVKKWNSRVGPGDLTYVLGDVSLARGKKAEDLLRDLLSQLNGEIVLVVGNHDSIRTVDVFKEFGHEVCDYLEINDFETKIVMSHYPFAVWNKGHYGAVMLHGHSHGTYSGPGRIQDVGWDVHGRILTLKEAYEMAMKKPIFASDHH